MGVVVVVGGMVKEIKGTKVRKTGREEPRVAVEWRAESSAGDEGERSKQTNKGNGVGDARWKLKERRYIGREWEECGKGRVEVWVWMGMGMHGYGYGYGMGMCVLRAMGNGQWAMYRGPWAMGHGRGYGTS